jgi:NAD(P)H-dependent FMN reductase
MLNLKIIIGSTRPGRAADRVIPWITATFREHGDVDVDVLDLRDWPLPLFCETFATVGEPHDPTFSVPVVKRWNAKIAEGNAYLFITPEYNNSIPAVPKNAVDNVFAFRGKPAAYVGYSGGIRAIEHLAHVAIEAEMVPLRNSVIIPSVHSALGPPGSPTTRAPAPPRISSSTTWPGGRRRSSRPGRRARCHPRRSA